MVEGEGERESWKHRIRLRVRLNSGYTLAWNTIQLWMEERGAGTGCATASLRNPSPGYQAQNPGAIKEGCRHAIHHSY